MLRWYESESSSTERCAPLILIPVQLDRSGVRESFKLRWTGDDIEANLSLEAKLKQDFGIRLPEMPAEEDLDVEDYLFRVEKAVAHDEVHLNFFSFSKLLIYKDLDAETWPEGGRPGDHPLVQQLFGGERRLNVLITRARRRCIVYCNFVGVDLDLKRSRAKGVQALKTFLEYAQHWESNPDVASCLGVGWPCRSYQ